jgi:DNA-binding XRE family transcriptional regulator
MAMKEIKIGDEVFRSYDTMEEAFPKMFKSKTFVKLYNEELAKLELIHQIKKLRNEKKMTQKELARLSKMPQSSIARIESGNHSFSLGTLYSIAKVFNKRVALV